MLLHDSVTLAGNDFQGCWHLVPLPIFLLPLLRRLAAAAGSDVTSQLLLGLSADQLGFGGSAGNASVDGGSLSAIIRARVVSICDLPFFGPASARPRLLSMSK